jgi:UDP-N-acetylmuramoyl-L-alanyl-D-glutamate--2,6-diaminopimelate ligase
VTGTDERRYYELLAPEYDEWALARGRYAEHEPTGWREELARLAGLVASLRFARVLDVACGTGMFTGVLSGDVVGLDQSEAMLELARANCPRARFVRGDALALPFEDGSFDLVFSGHLYSHLRRNERERFLAEAARVGRALVVVDSALRPGVAREVLQERALVDGSRHDVYKRFFRADELAEELAGNVLFRGDWFVAAGRGAGGRPPVRRTLALGTTEITGLAWHWSRVHDGDLFFCVEPDADPRTTAAAAGAMGAAALCVDRPTGLGLPELVVDDVRAAMASMSAAFYGRPADAVDLVGVTGTSGKTTTSFLLQSILAAAGRRPGVIGTLGARFGDEQRVTDGTTPEPCELHELLAEMRGAGVNAVAMEVTSHALALRRVDGLRFAAVGFTNLTRDHLDFHASLDEYFEAKQSLFTPHRAAAGAANVDDAYGRRLLANAEIPMLRFGLSPDAAVRAEGVQLRRDGSQFRLVTPAGAAVIDARLAGGFNVHNCLAAAAIALQAGVPLEAIAAGLRGRTPVPGRFEEIDEGQPFRAIVDFAHAPDSLERVLDAARSAAAADGARVICVFGCGGDRDRGKRPLMGAVAARSADLVIVTSDNSRSEEPEAIVADVLAGIEGTARRGGIVVRLDRAGAIRHALAAARPGDVVVIAGKGTERYQQVGAEEVPFDDRDVVRRLLREQGWGRTL